MRKQAGVHLTGPQHQHGTEGDPCWITECWSWYKGKPVGVAEDKCTVRVASRTGWGGRRRNEHQKSGRKGSSVCLVGGVLGNFRQVQIEKSNNTEIRW